MGMKNFMRRLASGVKKTEQATEEQREKLRKIGIKPAMGLKIKDANELIQSHHKAKQAELATEILKLDLRDKEHKERLREERIAKLDQDRKEREAKQELARNNGPELER